MASSEQQLRLSLAEAATGPPMAGAPDQDPRWRSLAEEATCPICLGYFTEAVSVHCGHTFCTPCITRYWQGVQGPPYPCPQCRETAPTCTLRPNRQLANMVQILAQGAPVAPPRDGHLMCTKHDEKLKLFCQEDQTPICVVCDRSREHQDHKVRPVLEAAQEYKDKFQSYLDDMKRKLENVLELQIKEEAKVPALGEKFKIRKERITSVFDKVQQFLEKEKCHHLNNLEEKEKKTLQRIRKKVSELEQQQALLKDQIAELELKCQQPDVELLKDVKSILSRFENVKSRLPYSGHVEETKKDTKKSEKEVEKEEIKKKGQEEDEEEAVEEDEKEEEEHDLVLLKKLLESLEWRWARIYAGAVTLDPDTAHRELILSADGRSVRLGDRAQDLPDTPERFGSVPCVLGRERLSAGRHYWEVGVGDKTRWSLGVSDESASRKGAITLTPEGGYWAVWHRHGKYLACTGPSTPLTLSVPPRVVGLFLDHEGGRLSVFNVSDRSLLFTFSGAPFPPTLRPFFCPEPREGGENAGALRVLPVTEQE